MCFAQRPSIAYPFNKGHSYFLRWLYRMVYFIISQGHNWPNGGQTGLPRRLTHSVALPQRKMEQEIPFNGRRGSGDEVCSTIKNKLQDIQRVVVARKFFYTENVLNYVNLKKQCQTIPYLLSSLYGIIGIIPAQSEQKCYRWRESK